MIKYEDRGENMPQSTQTIYNEGRVVGLSAYELYVKQFLGETPDGVPATEREWLSATTAMGSSLLMRIPVKSNRLFETDGDYIVDIPLPANSKLRAANTIIASFFTGEANFVGDSWFANKVTDYGLLPNTTQSSPSSTTTTNNIGPAPRQSDMPMSDVVYSRLSKYLQIVDGVILQPGSWATNANMPPYKVFTPDLTKTPVVRLKIHKPMYDSSLSSTDAWNSAEPYILLTGLTQRDVLVGQTKFEPELQSDAGKSITEHPDDGDFLGPQTFPWASKIIFTVPASAKGILSSGGVYERKLPASDNAIQLKHTSLIDMDSALLENFYTLSDGIDFNVTKFNLHEDTAEIFALYQQDSDIPPALYGAKIDNTGVHKMYPIDIQAPGSIKIFRSSDYRTSAECDSAAAKYSRLVPGATSFIFKDDIGRTEPATLYAVYNPNNSPVPVAFTHKVDVIGTAPDGTKVNMVDGDRGLYLSKVDTGINSTLSLSFNDSNAGESGVQLPISIDPSEAEANLLQPNYINWWSLLTALRDDKNIDILCSDLRALKSRLTFKNNLFTLASAWHTTGNLSSAAAISAGTTLSSGGDANIGGNANIAGNTSITGNATINKHLKGNTVEAGKNYITLNGIRLYISKTQPTDTDIPDGSIGIGWGLAT